MDIEHCVKSLPLDNNLPNEVEKLKAEGWDTPTGVPPVVVYHLVRVRKEPEPEHGPELPHSLGKLLIDDSKIFIQPAKK